jgi:hypothetical protein
MTMWGGKRPLTSIGRWEETATVPLLAIRTREYCDFIGINFKHAVVLVATNPSKLPCFIERRTTVPIHC